MTSTLQYPTAATWRIAQTSPVASMAAVAMALRGSSRVVAFEGAVTEGNRPESIAHRPFRGPFGGCLFLDPETDLP